MDSRDNFVFWIAARHKYLTEAAESQALVNRYMPDVESKIYTPDTSEKAGWYLNWLAKLIEVVTSQTLSGRQKLLFLDTDVRLLAPVYELFDILDRFDMAGAHAPGRETTKSIYNLSAAFPEINTGVLLMRCNERVLDFLHHWSTLFENHFDAYHDNDQGSFRDALWGSDPFFRFYVLPPEYHVRTICGGFAGNPVKILHGRVDNLDRAARHVNESNGMRIWGGFGET